MTEENKNATAAGTTTVDQAKTTEKEPSKTEQKSDGNGTGKHSDDEGDSWVDSLSEDKQKWIKKLRSEAAGNRVKMRELEEKLAKFQSDQETRDQEELKKQNKYKELSESHENKAKAMEARVIRTELKLHAQREGIIDLKDIDIISTDTVKILASGEIVGAEEAVKALKKERPHWFKTPEDQEPPESTGSTKEPGGASKPSTTKDVSKMSAEEFDTYTKDLVKGLRRQ